MIIVDENVDQYILDQLKLKQYEVLSIREHYAGVSDRDVLELTKFKKGIVVTEDKDFGELVFSCNLKECSVILLRYHKQDIFQIAQNLLIVLGDYNISSGHLFVAITNKKIRIRKI